MVRWITQKTLQITIIDQETGGRKMVMYNIYKGLALRIAGGITMLVLLPVRGADYIGEQTEVGA